jgi:hypothetical protein
MKKKKNNAGMVFGLAFLSFTAIFVIATENNNQTTAQM